MTIKLKEPSGNFLYYLGWGDAVIVAPETAENNKANPVGTGPFKFKSWTRGDRVELVRNPDYWQPGKEARERHLPLHQRPAGAGRGGPGRRRRCLPEHQAPELFADLKKDPRFIAVAGNTEGEIVAGLNNAKKPFDDVRVRRALMHASTARPSSRRLFGLRPADRQPLLAEPPGLCGYDGRRPYDPAKAKALLKEAGFGSGCR